MIRVKADVRPYGPAYNAALAVTKAIAAFAEVLTGDPEYFWGQGQHGAEPGGDDPAVG